MKILINSHLDYLTVSFSKIKSPDQLIPPAYHAFAVETDAPPLPNYNVGFKLACGGYINMSDSEAQGARLDLPGEALAYLREAGMKDEFLIKLLGQSGYMKRTTRADYCFNIMGGGSIRHVLNHAAQGLMVSKFRGNYPVVKYGTTDKRGGISPRGATVEFGSEKSEHRVAIYDKAADLKLLNQAWLRVELRTRKPISTNFTSDAAKFGYAEAARWRLAKLINYPKLAWWRAMMRGDNCPVSVNPRKPEKWREWMEKQVKASIKNHLRFRRDREFIESWLASVAEMVADYEDDDHETRYAGEYQSALDSAAPVVIGDFE